MTPARELANLALLISKVEEDEESDKERNGFVQQCAAGKGQAVTIPKLRAI